MTLRDIVLAVAVAACWGFAFVPIRLGVEELPPLLFTALRFFFSAVPAVFFLKPPKAPWRLVAGFGFVLGVVKFGLLFTAMKLGMPAGLSSLVMQMQVFFTVALAALVLRETPTRLQVIAMVVALSGVAVIAFSNGRGAPVLPFLMVLSAAFFWGIANLIAKQAEGADMLSFVVFASLVPPLPLALLSLMIEGPVAVTQSLASAGWLAAACVAFVSLVATLFCFSIWTRLLNRYPAAVVTPFALLIPFFGFLSGSVFLGESIPLPVLVGTALVMTGLCITIFGPRLVARFR